MSDGLSFPSTDELQEYQQQDSKPKYIIRGKYNDILSDDIGDGTIISGWSFIAKGVRVGSNCRFGNFVEIDKNSRIGDGVNIEPFTILTNDSVVGNNVFIGAYVKFIDEKYPSPYFDSKTRRPIVIKDGAIIGTNASLVCCIIGKNAVVGADSLVMKDIPDNEVWAGSPARPVMIKDEEGRPIRVMTRQDFDAKAEEQRRVLRG